MDLFSTVLFFLILGSMIILPLIYIRIRGNKDENGALYQKRESQDWKDTVLYHEGEEYLATMRHDDEKDEQKRE